MNNDRVFKLSRVAQLAETERDRAAGHLQERREQHGAAQSQLSQLQAFQQEYEQHLREASASGMSAQQLRDYRRFLASLAEAIQQQEGVVQRSDEALGQQRRELQQRSQHHSRMDDLVARYRKQAQRETDKQEQRQLDDRYAARHRGER